jgi:hypothetical protein
MKHRMSVRKVKGSGKRTYFAVGKMIRGKWTILRDPGVRFGAQAISIQLLYSNRKKALDVARLLNRNQNF